MNRAMQLDLGTVLRELEEAAEFLELLGVENPILNMSERAQERARSRGMMPIHPARACRPVLGSTAADLLGPPGAYAVA